MNVHKIQLSDCGFGRHWKFFGLAWKLEFVADSNVWKNMTIQSIFIIVNILNCLNTKKIVRILKAKYLFR